VAAPLNGGSYHRQCIELLNIHGREFAEARCHDTCAKARSSPIDEDAPFGRIGAGSFIGPRVRGAVVEG
jgi:hypothetical protein